MEKEITFDREKLESALRGGLKLNDCEPSDLDSLLLNAQEETFSEMKETEATLDLAALGAEYDIAGMNIKLLLGNYTLLHIIESPFVAELEEGETISFDDCCEALYILYYGRDAVEPIMHIQQKIKDMMAMKRLVAGNPELFDKLLDRIEKISQARSEFTNKARDFYLNNFSESQLQSIVESMINVLNDAILVCHKTEESSKKKIDSITK